MYLVKIYNFTKDVEIFLFFNSIQRKPCLISWVHLILLLG